MTASAIPAECVPAILRLLDEELAGVHHPEGDAYELSDVPPAVWDQALQRPLRELLSRPGKSVRGRFVEACWQIGCGATEPVPEVLPVVLEALHAGSLVIDDIEDGATERRGAPALHVLFGVPVALNAANWLYIWPHRLLARLPLPPLVRAHLHEEVDRALLRCHHGQALDLSARVFDLGRGEVAKFVRALTRLKTGSLMDLAARLGAIAGGAPDPVVRRLGELGREAGVGLQMLDDLSGILDDRRAHKGDEDLRLARATWPWAWLAEDFAPHTFEQALEHLRRVSGGAPTNELRLFMREHLAVSGKARASAQIAGAIRDLRTDLGDSAGVRSLCGVIERLEADYARG